MRWAHLGKEAGPVLAILLGLMFSALAQTEDGGFVPDPPAEALPAENQLAQPPSAADATAATVSPPPAPISGPQAADARWLRGVPPAGATVRLRLRDTALSAVLDPAQQWEVVAVDATGKAAPLVATLEMPAGETGWPVYTVGAAFGASRSDTATGDSFWPLILPDNRLPLAKLKLVASAPAAGTSQPKAVDIVRLDSAGNPLRSVASGVVSPPGIPGTQPNWFILAPETGPETWAVQVHDKLGSSAAPGVPPGFLQLSKVDAYAAEVMLTVTLPEQGVLQLRLGQRTGGGAVAHAGTYSAPLPPPAVDPEAAVASPGAAVDSPAPATAYVIEGEFAALRALSPAESAGAGQAAVPASASAKRFALPGWLPALGLGLIGAVLLWLGLKLLRPLPAGS